MSRHDGVDAYYKKSALFDTSRTCVVVTNVILALISYFSVGVVGNISVWLQVITAVAVPVLSVVSDVYWYESERIRRKDSIQNGFGVKMIDVTTDGYYNNDEAPSVKKWALDNLESNFFSMRVAQEMILFRAILFVAAVIAFLGSLKFANEGQVVCTITQAICSSSLIGDFVTFMIFEIRLKSLYERGYGLLMTGEECKEEKMIDFVMEYQCILAYYKVRLSSRIFKKNNNQLSEEWKKKIEDRHLEIGKN